MRILAGLFIGLLVFICFPFILPAAVATLVIAVYVIICIGGFLLIFGVIAAVIFGIIGVIVKGGS